ncbi:RNA polymerase sigma factor [Engelhardtia mirabilis]|uniref:RNA polymerase sigma factor n=1 Tax=Engelhardtia mirabilis TaxID=2528011 RepID=A0A518BLJ9_9BACT|nr:RNA polymerase sigma factor [Planctomycetes bacterium Pla133]QDV02173.1 RNA polymerase sigma factor [Planctomycetes bacterium Pla86]
MQPPRTDVPPDDDELVARLVAHDGRLRLLLGHLMSPALRSRFEADDLAQEVWLRLLSRPGRVPAPDQGPSALWAYVRIVARNTVIDAVRALRAARRDGTEQRLDRSQWSRHPWAELPGAGPGPATMAAGFEAKERLVAAFRLLEPEHRRVIGLRQFEGLDARATAERMGRSEAAVHSLYRRALAAWDLAAHPGPP